jgi:TPP-dependent pyruvate/acetoin dehydrogenase alpha subunit
MALPLTDEEVFRSLLRIRRVEEEVARIYPTDAIKSPVHLSIGQEAVSVGVCAALRPEDVVFGTYRGHALYLAKGGDLKAMIAELYGKSAGCAGGKGGSMHLIDPEAGVMGASAVVGTTIPQAVGYALSFRIRQEPRVVACFFGDGAVEEGVFHESLNFAALKRLPVLFICENNQYAIHTPQAHRQPGTDIYRLAQGYGIPAERIDDGDVFKIHERARESVAAMRGTDAGPRFLECLTYRWMEHVGPSEDFTAGYRAREEAEPWFQRDPVRVVGDSLPPALRERIHTEVEAEIREAFENAEASPFPEDAALLTDVYGEA